MAEELPPGTPEIDDPLLVADLIALLRIKGAIGRLPLADIVIPVVNLGDVVQPTVEVRAPVFRSVDVFSNGIIVNPATGAVLADTTGLVEGDYDVLITTSYFSSGATTQGVTIQHRNAANAANLAEWFQHISDAAVASLTRTLLPPILTFGYSFGVNERLRIINTAVGAVANRANAVIFARRRT